MKVRLNLSTKPLETHRKFLAGAGILGVVAGLFFIGLGLHVYAVRRGDEVFRERVVAVRSEMVNLDRQRAELEQFFSRPENAKLHDRSAFLNTLIDEQSLNWTQMFMDLERTLPPGVRIVHIEPKLDKGIVTVHFVVGAANEEAKLKLLKSFENSSSFSHVELLSDKAGTQQGADPLTIEFVAEYPNI